MKKTVVFVLVLSLLMALTLAGCGGGDKKPAEQAAPGEFKANMKVSSTQAKNHPYMVGAQKFADLIKERTNGRITMTLYPDSQLGKGEREMVEGMQQGTIDIVISSTGPLGGFTPGINILDIPFMFRDFAHVDKVLDGPIGEALLKDLEKSGVIGLSFWENGFRHLTNSKGAVKTAAEAKGLKIRTMENKVHLAAWKAAGLNPAPMAWGELYPALQQKVIDGQENPVAVFYSAKFWEVQKYFSLTGHVYSPAPIMISKKKWDAMPKADQELFKKTAMEVAQFQRKVGRDEEEAKLKEMAGKGLVVVRDVDKDSFKQAMSSAFEQFYKDFGKDKVEAIVNTK